MGTWRELLETARENPQGVRFSGLCRLVEHLGYKLDRHKGSHRIYRHTARRDLPLINLQRGGSMAKPYQVRQVLAIVEAHGLEVKQ